MSTDASSNMEKKMNKTIMFLTLARIQGIWGRRPCSLIASKPAASGKFSWRWLTHGPHVWKECGVSLSPWKQIGLCAEPFEYCQELSLPFSSIVLLVQLLSRAWRFVTPWITARQAFLFFTVSRSLLKLTSISRPLRCHPTLSSSVVPFSSRLQFFPASESFPINLLFSSGGQRIGVSVSAAVLPVTVQGWCPWGWTGWTSLQSKGLSRVFSNTTVQKQTFFGAKPSLQSNTHVCLWTCQMRFRWISISRFSSETLQNQVFWDTFC